MNPLIQFKKAIVSAVIAVVLGCFAFSPAAQAAPRPETPDPVAVGGTFNTADGTNALAHVTGSGNSAFGWFSLFSNTDGNFNTAVGAGTLVLNVGDPGAGDGVENTAVGTAALLFNTTGSDNNAVGVIALENNDSGFFNNALGHGALTANVDGSQNNAMGDLALTSNVSGSFNTAVGDDALFNCTGDSNVAVGDEAGTDITTGSNIIAIGAGVSGISTTNGELSDSCYIGNISGAGVNAGTAAAVFVDQDGKLGTTALPNTGTLPRAQALTGKVQELQAMVAQQQKQIEALTTGLQKVSAQLEVNKPAPQVVNNP
jgi:hypothetical protein